MKPFIFFVLISFTYTFPSLVWAAENIKINQFLPNPSNEDDEYIELINPNSESIDIGGYTLDDETNGGSKPYKIPDSTTISANSTLRFGKAQTGLALNNSKQSDQSYADVITLLDKSGSAIDSISYESTKTDQTISHIQPTNLPPAATTVPTSSPLPTSAPTSTSKPTPTKTPTHTPEPLLTPEVLAASTESPISSPVPLKVANQPQPAPKPAPKTLGVSLIGLGTTLVGIAVYLARYTK